MNEEFLHAKGLFYPISLRLPTVDTCSSQLNRLEQGRQSRVINDQALSVLV